MGKSEGDRNFNGYTSKLLKDAATQMNDEMGLEPPIEVEGLSIKALFNAIKDNAEFEERDDYSAPVRKLFELEFDIKPDFWETPLASDFKVIEDGFFVGEALKKLKGTKENKMGDNKKKKNKKTKKDDTDDTDDTKEDAPVKDKKKDKKGKAPTKDATKKKDKKKAAPKKESAGITEQGHRIGSMGAYIDGMLVKGVTEKTAVSTIVKKFDKEEDAALRKFRVHVQHLMSMHGAVITENKGKFTLKSINSDSH